MGNKLKLNDLMVHSFVTELDDDAANKIRGGSHTWTEGQSLITDPKMATCQWYCRTMGVCTRPWECCNPGPLEKA